MNCVFLIKNLFVSDLSHFLWVTVFDIECVLLLKEDISGELFGDLALVLLLKVYEGLLSSWHYLNLRYFSLTSRAKIDLEFFFSSSNREIFNEQTKVHDWFLVLEVVHLNLFLSLSFLFCLFYVQISELDSIYEFELDFWFLTWRLLLNSLDALNKLGSFFSWWRVTEAKKSETFGFSLAVSHNGCVLNFSELFEKLCEIFFSEAIIFRKAFDVHIVKCVFMDVHVSFLALILKNGKNSFSSITIRWQIILVHLKI